VSTGEAKDSIISQETACQILYHEDTDGASIDGAWSIVWKMLRRLDWRVRKSDVPVKGDARFPNGNYCKIELTKV